MKRKTVQPPKSTTRFSVRRSDKITKIDFFEVLRKAVSTRKTK